MNEYDPPKANVDLRNQPISADSSLAVVFKSAVIGCNITNLIGGLIILLNGSGKIGFKPLMIFALFCLVSTSVAFAVTLVYGKAVEYILIKLNLLKTAAFFIGGLLPSIAFVLYGAANSEKGPLGLALIIGVYAIPISLVGAHYSKKRQMELTYV